MTKEAQILDRYVLGPLIGDGGQSKVYEAVDTVSHEEVVIKSIPSNEKSIAAGLSELSTLLSVNHPNLIRVLDFQYEKDGSTILVYEKATGGSLRTFLKEKATITFDIWKSFARQALEALNHLHSVGLVHCDLKPENILITHTDENEELQFRIADFGLSRRPSTSKERLSGGSGSPAYMAPEAFTGKHLTTSDLYSLGVILYEMAAGQRPFSGDIRELAIHHSFSPVDLDQLRLPSTAAFIDQLLQKKPAHRIRNAKEALKRIPNEDSQNENLNEVISSIRSVRTETEVSSRGIFKQMPEAPSFQLTDFHLQSVFHIDSTAKEVELIESKGRPYILAKHMNHFEVHDGTNGKALNRFISVSGNNYHIINDDVLITYTDSNVYAWTAPFDKPKLLAEIGTSTQTLAVAHDLDRILWIEKGTVFQKHILDESTEVLMRLSEAGLPHRILFSRDWTEAIIIPGSTLPLALWFNENGKMTGHHQLQQPLLDSATKSGHTGISYPLSSEQRSNGISVWFFKSQGEVISKTLLEMPSTYSFNEKGLLYETSDGSIKLCTETENDLYLGQNPDRNSSLLMPESGDYFYTLSKTGLRHHFKLYKCL